MPVDKYDFPISVLEEFRDLQIICRDFQIQYPDLVGIKFSGTNINFHSLKAPGKLYYYIDNPALDANTRKARVHVKYKPRLRGNLGEYSIFLDMKDVPGSVQRWIELLRSYDQISLDPNERFVNQYQDEFYAADQILEEDADRAPFDEDRQKLLIYTLEAYQEAFVEVNLPGIDTIEIQQETMDLKNSIPTLTKNQVVRRWSRIRAKIKSKGYGFADAFYKEAKKYLVHILLDKGYHLVTEHVPKLIQHLLN